MILNKKTVFFLLIFIVSQLHSQSNNDGFMKFEKPTILVVGIKYKIEKEYSNYILKGHGVTIID